MNQTTKRSKELKEVHVGRNEVGKSVTGISLEAPKYSCIETKQDGVKVILEFQNLMRQGSGQRQDTINWRFKKK